MGTFRWTPTSVTHTFLILEMLSFEATEEKRVLQDLRTLRANKGLPEFAARPVRSNALSQYLSERW